MHFPEIYFESRRINLQRYNLGTSRVITEWAFQNSAKIMVFSGTKSLRRSVGWYIKARAILFLYLRRLISYIVDGTTQKLKEFRFVPSANTQAALDGVLLLVKRPRPIKTRGFMFSEASVEKRATKAVFWSFALSRLACNAFSSPKICNAKLAISSARKQTSSIIHGKTRVCV